MLLKVTMAQTRQRLARLPEKLTQGARSDVAIIIDNGEPVLAILPWNFYDGLLETLEILGDFQQMAALHESMQDVSEGRTEAWEMVKARLRIAMTREQQT